MSCFSTFCKFSYFLRQLIQNKLKTPGICDVFGKRRQGEGPFHPADSAQAQNNTQPRSWEKEKKKRKNQEKCLRILLSKFSIRRKEK